MPNDCRRTFQLLKSWAAGGGEGKDAKIAKFEGRVLDARTSWPGEPRGMIHFDLQTGQSNRFETDAGTIDATLGLDGWLYAMGRTGDGQDKIYVYNPATLARQRVIQLDDYYEFNQLTVNAKGELYVTYLGKEVFKISPYGQILERFPLDWMPTDIDVDPEGRVIFSTYHYGVKITDETFSEFSSIPAPTSSYVSFARHLPEPNTLVLLGVGLALGRRAPRAV